MSDRQDRKLDEVVVARYTYRHEAEFAAGFLKDAGIPYRLQIDDPSLGISVSTSATLWVLGMDERRAREILDVDGTGLAISSVSGRDWGAIPGPAEGPERDPVDDAVVRERAGPPTKSETALTGRERLISVVVGVGTVSTLAIEAIRDAPSAVWTGISLLGALLVVVGLTGHAPRVLRGFLSALSGDVR
ncbi:MAG: DUF2007 domain-containing protein [Gemmatimonadota bacterium]|nr:DUF2007 domain-containing protein [Gemmatimonadota bacterium]